MPILDPADRPDECQRGVRLNHTVYKQKYHLMEREMSKDPFTIQSSEDYEDYESTQYFWSYTIDIAPFKIVRGLGKWGETETMKQKLFLNALIRAAWNSAFKDQIFQAPYIFEFTKKDNVHAHGHFISTRLAAGQFQDYVKKQIGFPKQKAQRACYMDATYKGHSFWLEYEKKQQYQDYIVDDEGSVIPLQRIC